MIDAFDDLSAPCRALGRKSKPLRLAYKEIGAPLVRRREGGFEGLFRIIVEQQVSVPSAQAIWGRLCDNVEYGSPDAVIDFGIEKMRACGLSRPKAHYVDGVARKIQSEEFTFKALTDLNDADALDYLISLKGVGPWTAAIYLLFCEGRTDIWPPKDVALKAAFNAAQTTVDPKIEELTQNSLDELADEWTPYRGIAAHILWTYYARIRGRTPI